MGKSENVGRTTQTEKAKYSEHPDIGHKTFEAKTRMSRGSGAWGNWLDNMRIEGGKVHG